MTDKRDARVALLEKGAATRREALDLERRACSAPEAEHRIRAFFQVLGQAAHVAEPYEGFLNSLSRRIGLLTGLGAAR
ncbi:hypothetical protein ACFFHJ_32385 [Planotetraspora thailandica]|nr:hypothetical protein [Planotetraspora thailandica]